MDPIPFFDCNCMIGRRAFREPNTIYRAEDFIRELDYHNISAALAYHAMAKELNQPYGNERLLADIGSSPRLVPCWVVIPHHLGEMPRPKQLVAEMRRQNVRAARIFPKAHGFELADEFAGELITELERAAIPAFIDAAETDFPTLLKLCQAHPKLPVVLCGIAWGSDRKLYPLLEACPNVHVETASYQGHNSLDRICQRFGAERLLFGTGLPFMSPGPAKAMVMYSSISAEDKRKIASGNLLRLLGLSSLPAASPPQMDSIMATMERGEPVTCVEVLDAHAHIGHPGWLGIHQCSLHEQDAAAMVASMDTAGIRMAMISAWAGITSDEKSGNELLAQAVRDYAGRFSGYASFNPNYPEDLDAEMKRCFGQFGMKGFKPYPPRHQYPLDGPNNRKVLEYCNAHHLPILCHYGTNPNGSVTAAQVEKLSEQYLHAKFMFGHSGSSWEAARQTAAVAKKRHNVFMEITYTSVTFGAIEYMVKEAGADKVLFGSDFPMRDPHPQLAWVAYAKLGFEDKRKILGENFKAILADIR